MNKVFLNEEDVTFVKGSGKKPYEVKKVGGVVSCSCPAWRNIGGPIDVRVCKHIRKNIDRACLLPQAHEMYDASKSTKKTGKSTGGRKAAVKKDTAPPVLLAHKWENEDPTGWWISKKMDGVRCWWDGERFLSRLGNEYHAPQWYKDKMPKGIVLDGELFAGRGLFRKTISTVRKLIPSDVEWEKITYVVYDAPKFPGKFEARVEYLESMFKTWDDKSAPGDIRVLKQIKCKSEKHLLEVLKDEEERGGEGMMMREAGSLYEEGRSKTLLKVKTFFDAEAKVEGYTAGRGRHKGRVGSLKVSWNGVEFNVGTGLNDKQRENPPKIGEMITFRYQETSKKTGIPRFPSFVSVRNYE